MFWSTELAYIVTGGVVTTIIVIVWYYRRNKHSPPTLHYVNSDLHEHIMKSCERFTSPYRPPFWLQNNHVHTIMATLVPKAKVTFKREYLNLDDDGTIAVDWVLDGEEKLSDTSPVLIVLPGLTAGREDMGDICRLATDRGYRVVVFNKRGHGDSVLVTPKLQGFGDTLDLRHCVEFFHGRYPDANIVAVGSSAGSALLASYLGEYGSECILKTGVCICPGYDAVDLFVKGMSAFYEYLLLANLKKILKKHSKVLAPLLDLDAAYRSTRFTEFDTHVYCKIYGYRDVDEYWKHHNPMRSILNNAVPVMCINSLDDPICTASNIPFELFKENRDWLLVTTDKGGHCGFLEDHDWKPWSDKLALDYIDAVLEYQAQK